MIVNKNSGNSKVNFSSVHLKKAESFSKYVDSFSSESKTRANKIFEGFEAKLLDRPETDILVVKKMPVEKAKTINVNRKNPSYISSEDRESMGGAGLIAPVDAQKYCNEFILSPAKEDLELDLNGKTCGFKMNLDEKDDNIITNLMKTYKHLSGK